MAAPGRRDADFTPCCGPQNGAGALTSCGGVRLTETSLSSGPAQRLSRLRVPCRHYGRGDDRVGSVRLAPPPGPSYGLPAREGRRGSLTWWFTPNHGTRFCSLLRQPEYFLVHAACVGDEATT